jgi:cytochrome c-type biogenesis protein CcmH/NrfF
MRSEPAASPWEWARMAGFAGATLSALLVTAAIVIAVAGSHSGAASLDDRVRAIATQLRCPICQGESVNDSPSGLAVSMRTVIRDQLRQGRTSAQIERYFVERYGQWILLAPPVNGIGALAWLGPPVIMIIGLGLVAFFIHRWRNADEGSTFATGTPVVLDSLARGHSSLDTAIDGRSSPSRTVWRNASGLAATAAIIAAVITLTARPADSGAVRTAEGSGTPVTADVLKATRIVAVHPRSASPCPPGVSA